MQANNILENHYNTLLSELPTSAKQASKENYSYTFDTHNIPASKSTFITSQISIIKRQLYKPASLNDNLIIKMSKLSARSLAVHMLCIFLSNDNEPSTIQLDDTSSDVKTITIIKPAHSKSRIYQQPQKFIYQPQNPHEFKPISAIQKEAYEITHYLEFLLVNSQKEFADNFVNKNDLVITGSCGGMILLAEHLLNLGLDSSITNYINFEYKPIDKIDITVSENSCSGRIEIVNVEP